MVYKANLETGRPTVAVAHQNLLTQLRAARAAGAGAIKLIHGYGSSGEGGAIRADVHRTLQAQKAAGRIRDYVKGEDFSPFNPVARAILERCPELRKDADLVRQNHGITVVLLK